MFLGTALLLGALASPVVHASPPLSHDTLHKMDAYFDAQLRRAGFPGGTFAVVQGGETVFTSAHGVSDIDSQAPVSDDTVYCVGSISKSFTATALLQLRDKGLVDLDAPVTKYLPWFRVADHGVAEQITLRRLLTHTSGLPTNSHSVIWIDPDTIRNSIDQAVRALRWVHVNHAPGTRFEYANMNYVVLGRVIEAVSGMSWADYLQKNVFAPLGMTHTSTRMADVGSKLATAYWPEFGRLTEEPVQVAEFMGPASNILTTSSDLARYAAAHLGHGAPLVQEASLQEAHTGVADMHLADARYGFGWVQQRYAGVTVVHHGGAAGHAAEIWLIPEKDIAIVALVGAYSHLDNDRIAEGLVSLAVGRKPSTIDGLSELGTLMWTSRGFVAAIALCPVTLGTVLVLRRARRRAKKRLAPRNRAFVIARAAALTVVAAVFWVLILKVLPDRVPELPLPFGFHGWFKDLAMSCVAVLVTATGWALWGAIALVLHLRAAPVPVPVATGRANGAAD